MLPVCPKCDIKLFILTFVGVELDFCARCKGLWLDSGELEDILDRTGAQPDDVMLQALCSGKSSGRSRRYLCPRCDAAMELVEIPCAESEILRLERCGNGHGIWFDDQELTRLLELYPAECGTARTVNFLNDFLGCAVAGPGAPEFPPKGEQ